MPSSLSTWTIPAWVTDGAPCPSDPEFTADAMLDALCRMVRKQDYWRGYLGDDVEDGDVEDLLTAARVLLAARGSVG